MVDKLNDGVNLDQALQGLLHYNMRSETLATHARRGMYNIIYENGAEHPFTITHDIPSSTTITPYDADREYKSQKFETNLAWTPHIANYTQRHHSTDTTNTPVLPSTLRIQDIVTHHIDSSNKKYYIYTKEGISNDIVYIMEVSKNMTLEKKDQRKLNQYRASIQGQKLYNPNYDLVTILNRSEKYIGNKNSFCNNKKNPYT